MSGVVPPVCLADVMLALERLDVAGLHAMVAHAQGLLLDRPMRAGQSDHLAVEIVDRAEGALLMAYRALDGAGQRHLHVHLARVIYRRSPAPIKRPRAGGRDAARP